jgi:glycosyltransferase involved in cell wall biosynthesis
VTARPVPARILIISDAWTPQVNGVVRTLTAVAAELSAMGHTVEVIGPDRFRTMPCPTYPEIRLAVLPGRRLAGLIEAFGPDALHIATEGPLGLAARAWARRRGLPFTTAYHTRFPEYLAARFGFMGRSGITRALISRFLKWFHAPSQGVMVSTPSMREELAMGGFVRLRAWPRGVDLSLFRPDLRQEAPDFTELPRPLFAYVGRVAVEKNISAFLDLDLPGTKLVVGGGPQLRALKRAYPHVRFVGPRFGRELARAFASADVLVFPSLTDTFGRVVIEALASGAPVAAFPMTGPRDILRGVEGLAGVTDADVRVACMRAPTLERAACRAHAEAFTWRASAEAFRDNLVPIRGADIHRVGERIDRPPAEAAGRDPAVEARSAITLSAACRPESAAMGTPEPGCTPPPAR